MKRINIPRKLLLGTALVIGVGGIGATLALADITDPLISSSTQFLPTDQIQGIVRNGHQQLGGSLYQLAQGTGEQAVSCSMTSAASCTASFTNVYTQAPPICISQDRTGFVSSHATAAASSTTLLITASTSSSDVFVADCSGNPY